MAFFRVSSGGTNDLYTTIYAYFNQYGTVYFDINVYDSTGTLVYTKPRMTWSFSRESYEGVRGTITVNTSDDSNINISETHSPFNM